jgi:hypothetical protein
MSSVAGAENSVQQSELVALRAAVATLNAKLESITALQTPIRKQTKPNKYTPRPSTDHWASKDVSVIQAFLEQFLSNREAFVVRSPLMRSPSGIDAKIMVSKATNAIAPPSAGKGKRTHYSLTIADLFARMVEFASAAKAADPSLSDAVMDVQKTHESPGFLARKSRGSGLVMNCKAETALLPKVIDSVFESILGLCGGDE